MCLIHENKIGKSGKDFFLDFLEVEFFDSKQKNRELIHAIDNFIRDDGMDKDTANSSYKIVKDMCSEAFSEGDEVSVLEISDSLPDTGGRTFSEFTQEQNFDLDDTIPVEKVLSAT